MTRRSRLICSGAVWRRGEVEGRSNPRKMIPRANCCSLEATRRASRWEKITAVAFDRAEEFFEQLVDSETHSIDALEGLVNIYEQEHEWLRAIEIRQRLKATP